MPNHVTTILNIDDSARMSLDDITAEFINDKGQISFNKVIPMPKCLEDFNPSCGSVEKAKAALGLFKKPSKSVSSLNDMTDRLAFGHAMRDLTVPADRETTKDIIRCIQNYQDCGFMYWYDWCPKHWGTKWDAYGQPDDGYPKDALKFEFQTAWGHPFQVIEALSTKLPTVTFSVWYADEDIGSNCGRHVIKAGQKSNEDGAPNSDEMTNEQRIYWRKTAFHIVYGADADPRQSGYDQNWEYSDEVYEASNA